MRYQLLPILVAFIEIGIVGTFVFAKFKAIVVCMIFIQYSICCICGFGLAFTLNVPQSLRQKDETETLVYDIYY